MVKLAYSGDLVLQEIEGKPEKIFSDLKSELNQSDVNLIINLESPFVMPNTLPAKQKIVLQANPDKANYLSYLNPYLINLSNNHITDFGNSAALLTKDIIKKHQIQSWGIGLNQQTKSIFYDHQNKIIQLAFTTRSADFTGSVLHATDTTIGAYPPDPKLIVSLKKQYHNYLIIINIHWGIEDIRYPEPSKRTLAYQLIDSGADLIIGHHPHIIQPAEIYKGKTIFYSLGNFYFKDILRQQNGRLKKVKMPAHRKKGVIPIFKISDQQITIDRILQVSHNNGPLKVSVQKKFSMLSRQTKAYLLFHYFYLKIVHFRAIISYVLHNPRQILKKYATKIFH